MRSVTRLAILIFVCLVGVPMLGSGSPAFADVPTLNGTGSSFAQLEIQAWKSEVASKPYQLEISYVAQGSTYGRSQYIQGTVDWAASDIPFQAYDLAPLSRSNRGTIVNGVPQGFVYVPVSAGGLSLMYNIADTSGNPITSLHLTRHAACQIFTDSTGSLYWDELPGATVDAGVTLPHTLVRPIVRADGSGTSYVMSEFCIAVAKDLWDAFVASQKASPNQGSNSTEFLNGQPTSNWPQQFGKSGTGNGADGVATAVADPTGDGSITYNESGFARQVHIPNAFIENGAGKFLQPDDQNVSAALAYATGRPDGTFKLNYTANDPNAYFPSTYSYVVAQTTGFDPAKGWVLAKFLCYAVTYGQRQELTDQLDYARLSQPLVDLAHAAIEQIPGAPPWGQCAVSGAVAPPAVTTTTKAPTPGVTTTTKAAAAGATTTKASAPGAVSVAPAAGAATTVVARVATNTTKASGAKASTTATTKPGSSTNVGVAVPVTAMGGAAVTAADGSTVTVAPTDPAFTASPQPDDTTANTDASGGAIAASDSGGGQTQSADGQTQSAGAQAQVPVKQAGPVVAASKIGIDGQQVTWVLLQGAGVCGLGVLLAGVSRAKVLKR